MDTVAGMLRRVLIAGAVASMLFRPLSDPGPVPAADDFALFYPTQTVRTYNFNENDEYVLLQIAMAEAGDQDVEGKALVMNVVMNRIRNEEFPGTVEEVVMQPGQFEPVDNGSFYEVTPDWECVEALEMVAAGWDGSQGATYFEESYAGSWQSVNLEKLFVHGCHTFYKDKI